MFERKVRPIDNAKLIHSAPVSGHRHVRGVMVISRGGSRGSGGETEG